MKRLFLCILGLGLSATAFAQLPDLSGTYQCHGWDAIGGEFKGVEDTLTLSVKSNDKEARIQGYTFSIKNYGDVKAQYTGFGTTSDGVHMAAYFANIDAKASTDNGVTQFIFNAKHGTYSGDYYQPTFAEGNKTYDYGHVVCKRIKIS